MTFMQIVLLICLVMFLHHMTRRRAAPAGSARAHRREGRFWDRHFWGAGMDMGCCGTETTDERADARASGGKYADLSREEMEERLETLEERLRVLERIVTDKGYNLSEEIDRL